MGAGASVPNLPTIISEHEAQSVLQDLYSESNYLKLKNSSGHVLKETVLDFLGSATDVFLSHDWESMKKAVQIMHVSCV